EPEPELQGNSERAKLSTPKSKRIRSPMSFVPMSDKRDWEWTTDRQSQIARDQYFESSAYIYAKEPLYRSACYETSIVALDQTVLKYFDISLLAGISAMRQMIPNLLPISFID